MLLLQKVPDAGTALAGEGAGAALAGSVPPSGMLGSGGVLRRRVAPTAMALGQHLGRSSPARALVLAGARTEDHDSVSPRLEERMGKKATRKKERYIPT